MMCLGPFHRWRNICSIVACLLEKDLVTAALWCIVATSPFRGEQLSLCQGSAALGQSSAGAMLCLRPAHM